jgi:hypothetical protein
MIPQHHTLSVTKVNLIQILCVIIQVVYFSKIRITTGYNKVSELDTNVNNS